jgi:hypothetical protein
MPFRFSGQARYVIVTHQQAHGRNGLDGTPLQTETETELKCESEVVTVTIRSRSLKMEHSISATIDEIQDELLTPHPSDGGDIKN